MAGNLNKHIKGKHKLQVVTLQGLRKKALESGKGYPNYINEGKLTVSIPDKDINYIDEGKRFVPIPATDPSYISEQAESTKQITATCTDIDNLEKSNDITPNSAGKGLSVYEIHKEVPNDTGDSFIMHTKYQLQEPSRLFEDGIQKSAIDFCRKKPLRTVQRIPCSDVHALPQNDSLPVSVQQMMSPERSDQVTFIEDTCTVETVVEDRVETVVTYSEQSSADNYQDRNTGGKAVHVQQVEQVPHQIHIPDSEQLSTVLDYNRVPVVINQQIPMSASHIQTSESISSTISKMQMYDQAQLLPTHISQELVSPDVITIQSLDQQETHEQHSLSNLQDLHSVPVCNIPVPVGGVTNIHLAQDGDSVQSMLNAGIIVPSTHYPTHSQQLYHSFSSM